VNQPDNRGQTPLFFAARQGHLPMARLLLDAGADTELLDKKGRRASDIARKSADKAIAERNRSIALRDDILTLLS
jgi:ankyrin repeat protein